jgi:prepilin-type N-terminal cleavage/methylation domain-containing protein
MSAMTPVFPRSVQPFCARRAAGFTLLELLSVTTLFVILLAIAGDLVRGDRQRASVAAATDEMQGLFELARWEARSKATYVWLCLRPAGGANGGVEAVLLASRDGTANSSADNLMPASPKRMLRGIRLPASGDATPARLLGDYTASSILEGHTGRIGGSDLSITLDSLGTFADTIVGFNPRGELFVPGRPLAGFLEVVISPETGGASAGAKSSALLVSQSTGAVRAFR